VTIFVDTWGWLTLARETERSHRLVKALVRTRSRTPGRLVTTDFVLDEMVTRLFAGVSFRLARRFTEGILRAAADGFLTVERITPERFMRAIDLRMKFDDKPDISFTDLTSFVVMKELGITDVITADAHFRQVGLGFHTLPE
jgi:predicted nucleic acid-binding protein